MNWKQELLEKHKPYVWPSIDCEDGWRPLIEAFYALVADNPCMVVAQVKEKYGTLCLYWDHDHEACEKRYWEKGEGVEPGGLTLKDGRRHWESLMGIVKGIEYVSAHMCEVCGQVGKVRPGGWVVTRCDECNTKETA